MSDLATVVRAGEGELLEGMGISVRILFDSKSCDGRQGAVLYTVPAGMPGPPLHRHSFDEHFFVIEGTLTFAANGEQFDVGPESSVFVPGGSPHTFANLSAAPATFLIGFVPGGFEKFFREAFLLLQSSDPGSIMQKVSGLNAKYGVEMVGPPIGV